MLGLWGAIGLGARTGVGLALFAASPVIITTTGWATPAAYGLAALLLLPIVLTYLELAGASAGNASPYSLMRVRGVRPALFYVGWLLLGGMLAMSAFFAWAIGVRLQFAISGLLNLEAPLWGVIAVVVVVLFLYEVISSRSGWRPRGILTGLMLLAVLGAILWMAQLEPTGRFEPADLASGQHWLKGIAVFAAVLWAVTMVLNHGDQVRRPRRTVPMAILIIWFGSALLSALFIYEALRHPGLTLGGGLASGSIEVRRLQLLNVGVGILVCSGGASAALASALRLQRRMALDGYLPGGDQVGVKLISTPALPLLVFSLAWLVPALELVGIVSTSVLWCSIAVFVPFARTKREERSRRDGLRLPLHPLGPGVAIALCAAFSLVMPSGVLTGIVLWLATGGAAYALYSGRRSGAVRRGEVELSDTDTASEALSKGRLLVLAGPDAHRAAELIRFGSALAAGHGKELLVLRVEPRIQQIPMSELRLRAEESWTELSEIVERASLGKVATQSIVRIAPNEAAGVLEAAREYEVNLVLVGAAEPDSEGSSPHGDVAEQIFKATGRPLAILTGDMRKVPKSLMVATSGGPHAAFALETADALAAATGGTIVLASVAPPGSESANTAMAAIQKTLDQAEVSSPVARRHVEGRDPVEALVKEAEGFDLLLVGSSSDQLLKHSIVGGLAARIAFYRAQPTLIVKKAERQRKFWLRRLWEVASRPLPTLEPQERAAVYSEMRLSARANVDYYVLIFLASMIATCGLLLDSVAVIVGAMLVAPLMSPILAIAQGVVVGNDVLIRRAAASTFKGISVAVGLGVVAGLLLPARVPSAQMLARGEPNVLDLLVAVAAGAAAAYGVCRSSVAAALPGVAISVALVPPLCVAGWALGAEEFRLAGGALLLFLTNLAGIVLVGALVFLLFGFRPTRTKRNMVVHRALLMALVTIGLISIPLALKTRYVLRAERLEAEIESRMEQSTSGTAEVAEVSVRPDGEGFRVELTLFLFRELEPGDLEPVESLRAELEETMGVPIRVRTTVVRASVLEAGPAPNEAE